MADTPFNFVAVGQSLILEDLREDTTAAFRAIWSVIEQADVAFTNFEATVHGTHGGFPLKEGYCHAAPTEALDTLWEMGFRLLSLSNNHSFDLGPSGILSTLDAVAERGFIAAGTGQDKESANAAGIGRVGTTARGEITAALIAMDAGPQGAHVYARDASQGLPGRPGANRLGVDRRVVVSEDGMRQLQALSEMLCHEAQKASRAQSGYYAPPDEGFDFYGTRFVTGEAPAEMRATDVADRKRHISAIEAAAETADFVVAYVHHHHWENDWEDAPRWLGDFARECIDAGAHAFVSHGIPMALGIEIYRQRPIFYSLGNFIYHTQHAEKRAGDDRIWQSVVAQCRFDNAGLLSNIVLTPIALGGEKALRTGDFSRRKVPEFVDPSYGEEILGRIQPLCSALGTTLEIRDGNGYIAVDDG